MRSVFLVVKRCRSGLGRAIHIFVNWLIDWYRWWYRLHLWLKESLGIRQQQTKSIVVARTADRTACQRRSMSSKVNDFHVIWKDICHFLLVINSNLGPISYLSEIRPLIAWNFPFKIAVKPLQTETWLLLTAYNKLPALNPMVPLQTGSTYRLATIGPTPVTENDDRRQRTTTAPQARPLIKYGRLKTFVTTFGVHSEIAGQRLWRFQKFKQILKAHCRLP